MHPVAPLRVTASPRSALPSPGMFRYNSDMTKHTKSRAINRLCEECGAEFVTGSSIMVFCSTECRVRSVAKEFHGVEGCWEWPGSRNPQTGYGQLSAWVNGKRKLYTAHRISFRAMTGEIPNGMQVLHKCDNRPCFNPGHLFLGTQLTNMRDMAAKGRCVYVRPDVPWQHLHPEKIPRGQSHHLAKSTSCLPRGAAHHNAKLTDDDIRIIRASNDTLLMLSTRFGISKSTASSIRRCETWKHVA